MKMNYLLKIVLLKQKNCFVKTKKLFSTKQILNWTHKRSKFLWINFSIAINISIIKHRTSWIILITFSCNIRCTNSNIRTNTINMTLIWSRTLSIFFIFNWIFNKTSTSNIKTNFICYCFCCIWTRWWRLLFNK